MDTKGIVKEAWGETFSVRAILTDLVAGTLIVLFAWWVQAWVM